MQHRTTVVMLAASLAAAAVFAELDAPQPGAKASGVQGTDAPADETVRRMIEDLAQHPAGEAPPAPPAGPFIDVGRGPIPVVVPPSYDPEVPAPLVIALHGYTSSGQALESWVGLTPLADEFGFLYLYPDGSTDCLGNRFWNATDACCNFCGSGIDDSGYLLAVVDEMKAQYTVDDARVYFVGHSNGGFMSYRMACDHSETIAAIASLAGATFLDPNDCAANETVNVLQIHGTSDGVISYNGGCIFGDCYPGAVQTVETWAVYDGCTLSSTSGGTLDLVADLPGEETTVTRYVDQCDPGGSAELWTMAGGVHSPNLSADFGRYVVEYLLAHPKPPVFETVLPGAFNVTFGAYQSGDAQSLHASDDDYLVIEQRAALSVLLPLVRVEIEGNAGGATASQIVVTVETGTNAIPSQPPQRLSLLNYDTALYDIVDERPTTLGDSVVTVAIVANADAYLEDATHALAMRLDWFDPGNVFSPAWTVRIDQAVWEVAP